LALKGIPLSELNNWGIENIDKAFAIMQMENDNEAAYNGWLKDNN